MSLHRVVFVLKAVCRPVLTKNSCLFFVMILLFLLFVSCTSVTNTSTTLSPTVTRLLVSDTPRLTSTNIPASFTPQLTFTPAFTPEPTLTFTVVPVDTPNVFPTEDSLFSDLVISPDLAVLYKKALWDNTDGVTLTYKEIDGCTIELLEMSERPTEMQVKEIGGFEYAVYDEGERAYYLSLISPSGERSLLMVSAPTETVGCYEAAEMVLANLKLVPGIVQSEICPWAPPTRLKIGDRVTLLTIAWSRTEPRWADNTEIERLSPRRRREITILAGPVCAIYPDGEYLYWQVKIMPDDVIVWLAEGSLKEYFLEIAP